MKRFSVLLIVLLAITLPAGASTIDINGIAYPVDTIAHYQVGPGTWFSRFNVRIGSVDHHLYLLDADLTNPYLKVEEHQAANRMGETELMSEAHLRIDSVCHHPIGSVNGNFWVVSSQATGNNEGLLGQPFAGSAKDGMLIGEPESWNSGHGDRGYVMIDDMNRALIRNLEYKGRVYKDGSSASIREVNRNRVHPNTNEIALFNRYCGTATRAVADTVIEVVFDVPAGWSINDSMTCVVTALNTTGGTALTGNMGALQARGSRGNWCRSHLAVGDTFRIKLGMYATSITPDDDYSADSVAPHVMQMVTGNCLVMADGQLTSRNSNEQYNNQNYPRTMLATNDDGTHFWMLVSEKPGNYTAEMCGILRNDGATWAAGMDGGGSAQMNLFGQILNPTTETTPRPVANGMFMVCVAPETDVMERIERVVDTAVVIPSYTRYTPALRIYSQYGRLMPENQPYTITVSPASLGSVTVDGRTFIAGAQAGSGTLTVSAGGATLDIPLTIVNASMQLRIDTILTDHRPYTLEVQAGVGNPVPANVLTWTSDDEMIAVVEDGVLRGVSNGVTIVRGQLEEQMLPQVVRVEIPQQEKVSWGMLDDGSLGILEASGSFNPSLSLTASSYMIAFDYSIVRNAYVRMTTDRLLYSLPDSIVFHIKTDAEVTKVRIYGRSNHTMEKGIFVMESLPVGEWNRVAIPMGAWLKDAQDRISYPVHFTGMEFTLDSKTAVGSRSIEIADKVELIYSDWQETTTLENIESSTEAIKRLENGRIIIIRNGVRYSVLGHAIE